MPKKAGGDLSIIFSKVKVQDVCILLSKKASKRGERQNSNRRRKFTDSGKRDRPLGKNTGITSEHAGLHAKVHLEPCLASDVKDNKGHFFKYIRSKRKTRENEGPLLNEVGALVTKDIVKTFSQCPLCFSLYC